MQRARKRGLLTAVAASTGLLVSSAMMAEATFALGPASATSVAVNSHKLHDGRGSRAEQNAPGTTAPAPASTGDASPPGRENTSTGQETSPPGHEGASPRHEPGPLGREPGPLVHVTHPLSTNAAVAWGDNYPHEQLGAGYGDRYEASPVSVAGLTDITAMASAYNSSFALLGDGTVMSWGGNDYGQLGDDSRTDSGTPVAVRGLPEEVKAISAAGVHVLALLKNGEVMAWGNGDYGELGTGKAGKGTYSLVAQKVPGLTHVVAIASGGASNFALEEHGTLMAWGKNNLGMLGLGNLSSTELEACTGEAGTRSCSTVPRPVDLNGLPAGVTVTAISAGTYAAYAVLSNGGVLAWGDNAHGQLGTGNAADSNVPVAVNMTPLEKHLGFTPDVVAVSGGDIFALGLLRDGEVIAWGSNGHGELGGTSSEECSKRFKTCSMSPRLVSGLVDVTAISAGASSSLALSAGTMYSFGDNERGQLGIGGTTNTNVPTPIKGVSHVGGIAAGVARAGEAHSLAFLESGDGPVALLSVKPGRGSLELSWTFAATEDKIRWRRVPNSAALRASELRAFEYEAATMAAEAAEEPEEAGRLGAEAASFRAEAQASAEAGKWSSVVRRTGALAEACSAEAPCHYVIDEDDGEELQQQAYEIQVNVPAGETKRKITATPLS
jgi:alpha-tubulin suppressor-like RCC1 family protein